MDQNFKMVSIQQSTVHGGNNSTSIRTVCQLGNLRLPVRIGQERRLVAQKAFCFKERKLHTGYKYPEEKLSK